MQQIEMNKLSDEQKIELAMDLWKSVAKTGNSIEIPDEHKQILQKRLEILNAGNLSFRSWQDVKNDISAMI